MAVVAPSGRVPRDRFLVGVERLAGRYELVHDDALFSAHGYLAGDDDRRFAELSRALSDPTVRGVLCARGGYGLTRLLGRLEVPSLAIAPRVIAGFSDVTALHALLARAGVASVHAPVLTQLGELDDADTAALLALVEDPAPPPAWTGLGCLVAGRAEGHLVGGNLEVLTRLLGTPHMPPLDGAILVLEEVDERPYRIDRALTHLEQSGVARRVAAVVVGDLVRCVAPPGTPSASEVIAERLERWSVPVVDGAPFGHGVINRAFPLGARALLDAEAGSLTFLEGAVS